MKIIEKKVLSDYQGSRLIRFVVEAPRVAVSGMPGQFVVVMVKPESERLPLTIVDKDEVKQSIVLIVQEIGASSRALGALLEGDSLFALAGPLGLPTEIPVNKKVLLVAGGVGSAEILPVAKALKKSGNKVITVLGARTKGLVILEDDLKKISSEFYAVTDDGSHGHKGLVTDVVKKLFGETPEENKYDLVYAVGPIPMMAAVSSLTRYLGIKTMVSLNALMVDGTGMCGCCRVTVGKELRFACLDGPEFDGHLVDWKELASRSRMYQEQESHICRLLSAVNKHNE